MRNNFSSQGWGIVLENIDKIEYTWRQACLLKELRDDGLTPWTDFRTLENDCVAT